MYLKVLTIFFVAISILLAISIIVQKTFMKKLKNTSFAAIIATFLFLYILLSFSAVILFPNYISKLIMLLFGISPFIIGKFATYKTEPMLSFVQIISVVSSGIFVWFNWMIS